MSSVREYGELFERLHLTELSVEDGNLKLQLKREGSAGGAALPASPVAVQQQLAEETESHAQGEEVKAPLLGVFYAKENGPAQGDAVKKGDVLCSIEAMKMMNEVKAPRDGVILETAAEDGALVEYGQTLFVIG